MTQEIALIGFYLFIFIYSVIIHEVAHGVMALWLGDLTAKYADRLNLNPMKHVDPFGSLLLPGLLFLTQSPFLIGWAKPVPYNPYNLRDQKWGPTYVALAGPASNFLMALIAAVIASLLPMSLLMKRDILGRFYGITGGQGDFLDRFELFATAISGSLPNICFGLLLMIIFWNVVLGCFNLLPIPPLDGSKILYSLFGIKEQTMLFLEQYGLFIMIFVVLFFQQPISIFIGTVLQAFLRLALS
jgi:Zn-dependent protease